VYNVFVSVTISILTVTNMSGQNFKSNAACANARLKRKLMLKEKKMKCAKMSQSVQHDQE